MVDGVILLNSFNSAYGIIRKKQDGVVCSAKKYCNLIITSLAFALKEYNNGRIIAKSLFEARDEAILFWRKPAT